MTIKPLFSSVVLWLLTAVAHGAPTQAGPKLEAIGGERYAEEWSHMGNPGNRSRSWHKLKWIDLGEHTHLSLGGDLKWRSEYIDAPYFGVNDEEADFYVLQRIVAHGDLRINPNIRVFTQLGYHKSFGRKAEFPFDDDRTDFQQGFIDVTRGTSAHGAGIRIGRQEIVLSPRFTTPRGALNIRAAFDGVRGWVGRGQLHLDAFATWPVVNKSGAFDDRADDNQRFDAARLTYTFGKTNQWYVKGSAHRIDRELTTVGFFTGRDNRTSWSIRLKGHVGAWDFDGEHYQQTGKFADLDIDAFGGGGEIGYTWRSTSWMPRIGIRWLYGSGDPDVADDEYNTFLGPGARPPCCEDALWLAPANMIALTPVLGIKPIARLSLEFKVDFIQRHKKTDGIYAAGRIAYADSIGRSSTDWVSTSAGMWLTWTPTDDITIRSFYATQSADGALADIGGSRSTFSTLTIHVRF